MTRHVANLLSDFARAYGVGMGKTLNPRRELKRMWHRLASGERPAAQRRFEEALALRGNRRGQPSPDAMLGARRAATACAPARPMPAIARVRAAQSDRRARKAAARERKRAA